jgi:hypothetical protein
MAGKKTKYDVTAPEWVEDINRRRFEREGREGFARAAEKHDEIADGLHLMKMKTKDSAEAHVRRARDLWLKHGGGTMPPADYSQWVAECRAAEASYATCDAQEARERSYRKIAKRQAKVSRDPSPYEEGSPHSWVRDVLASREPDFAPSQSRMAGASDMSPSAVLRRLDQHGQDIAAALKRDNRFGREARAMLSESVRCESEHDHEKRAKAAVDTAKEFTPPRREARAFGTGGGATASQASPAEASVFVPPKFVLAQWASWRTPFASFATACKQEDLPEYGLNVYVPRVSGEMEQTSQVENASVAEKAPTTVLTKSAVVNKAGQIRVSYQLLDRAGPGVAGDEFLFQQLKVQLETGLDEYAINQSLIESQTVTNSEGTFKFSEKEGVGGFLGDIRKGKNLIATTGGVRHKASHIFAPSKLVNYVEAFATSTGGPVWTPELDGNEKGPDGDPKMQGYTAYVLSECKVFADDNIPLVGTSNIYQVLITRADTILVFRSAPVFYTFRETYGNTMDAALGARIYTCCIPRWPEAVVSLSGAFYKTSTFN